MPSHLQRVSSTVGAVGNTTSHTITLCAPRNDILPAWATQGANPDVPSGGVLSGGGWHLQCSLCPDSTKGPARQPRPALPLSATHAFYSRPWCNGWGPEWGPPLLQEPFTTIETSYWDLETHPIVGSPLVAVPTAPPPPQRHLLRPCKLWHELPKGLQDSVVLAADTCGCQSMMASPTTTRMAKNWCPNAGWQRALLLPGSPGCPFPKGSCWAT